MGSKLNVHNELTSCLDHSHTEQLWTIDGLVSIIQMNLCAVRYSSHIIVGRNYHMRSNSLKIFDTSNVLSQKIDYLHTITCTHAIPSKVVWSGNLSSSMSNVTIVTTDSSDITIHHCLHEIHRW